VVQTLAAVAVHDPSSRFDDDVVAMTRAAGATRYAAVTIASRAALTTVGPCTEGDVLGLVDGDIVIIGQDVSAVAREMLAGMLAIGGELVTFVWGQDADPTIVADLPEWVASRHPLVEVVVHDGGQPLWPIILGVE
jgi:dihydroxyacetone kinase-like predicted kinase